MISVVEYPAPVKVTTLFSIFAILKKKVAKLLTVSDKRCLKLFTPLTLQVCYGEPYKRSNFLVCTKGVIFLCVIQSIRLDRARVLLSTSLLCAKEKKSH